jgi:hypothetical protein
MSEEQWIVVIGSPSDGFTFHGPFDDHEDALHWVEGEKNESWWISDLQAVDETPAPSEKE